MAVGVDRVPGETVAVLLAAVCAGVVDGGIWVPGEIVAVFPETVCAGVVDGIVQATSETIASNVIANIMCFISDSFCAMR